MLNLQDFKSFEVKEEESLSSVTGGRTWNVTCLDADGNVTGGYSDPNYNNNSEPNLAEVRATCGPHWQVD